MPPSKFILIGEPTAIDLFGFQGPEERLCLGVVIAVALAADTLNHLVTSEFFLNGLLAYWIPRSEW